MPIEMRISVSDSPISSRNLAKKRELRIRRERWARALRACPARLKFWRLLLSNAGVRERRLTSVRSRPMAERWRRGSVLNGLWRPSAFALGFALAGVAACRKGLGSRAFIRAVRGRSAVHRQDVRPRDGHLSAIGLVPFKNSLAFAVQDAQRDRFRCEGEICCSNNCSGHVQRLNFDLAQDQQSTTWRGPQKLKSKTAAASRPGCASVHRVALVPNEVEACAHLPRDPERKPHSSPSELIG